MAQFRECGGLVLESEASSTFLSRVVSAHDEVGLQYEKWDAEEIRERLGFDLRSFGPQRRIDDEVCNSCKLRSEPDYEILLP